jgi:release factor glutamine methyltransferase
MSSHDAPSNRDAGAPPWTIARLLKWTQAHFESHSLESPRLCAELLLAHALGCQRLDLYLRFEEVPGEPALARFRERVRQAAAGRPISYLTGTKEFFSLTFEVTPDVLIPRPETEVLVERAIAAAHALASTAAAPPAAPSGRAPSQPARRPTGVRILDLCTGSGCVAISLARYVPDATVCASDLSAPAVDVARRNAVRLAVAERVELRCGDLFAAWEADRQWDMIVCNPPYIGTEEADDLAAGVREHEPGMALFAGPGGLEVHRRVAAEGRGRLSRGGHLLLEVGFRQAQQVRALLEGTGWRDIVTYRDDLRHERVVHARS